MRIEGVQFTIIGVMPPSFFGLKVGKISDVAIPLAAQESIAPMGRKLTNVDVLWINTIARLKAGISPVQASTNIETIWPQILETLVSSGYSPARRASFLRNRLQLASAARGISDIRERFSKPLFLLLLLGTLVMIVACVNIGLLTLARTIERHHEIALRLSIGASRIRIAMQLIAENALLCLISAAAALAHLQPRPAPNEDMSVYESYVGPGYHQTFGLKLRAGRDFTFHDAINTPAVALVSETFAKRFFGTGEPLGKRVSVSQPKPGQEMQIIGVVSDSQFRSVRERPPALLYRAVFQNPRMLGNMTLSVRSNANDRDGAEAIRTQVAALGRELPVHVRSLEQQIDESLSQDRLLAVIASTFGIIGMIVGCLGLYGLTIYTTARRRNEIGIRLALGANPRNIFVLVYREMLLIIAVGVAIGVAFAAVFARTLSSMLFDLPTVDIKTFLLAGVLATLTGLAACSVPSIRATRIGVVDALRHD